MRKPQIGVVLAGCGVYDGAEIHESVLTLLALEKAGAHALCFAPNVAQAHVVNHLSGQVAEGETRNVLVEAARIARGNITDLSKLDPAALDAIILPGGFGAAKNLCDFAFAGPDCTVNPDVARAVQGLHAAGKPVGAVCIAPVILARLLGEEKPRVTIGTDKGTASAIEKMGGCHIDCAVEGMVVDEDRRVVTTPAYMLANSISEAAAGIEKLVFEVVKMARAGVSTIA
ncbi:MAG: isoprenoid biosynthesis glyoxalase ElbB [Acidobacteria bacterium]|nr:isoprenoid biosynthesis glyoxalase ElbB [Acidobacteriota bacterium]